MAVMESGPSTSSHSDGVPSMLPAHVEAPITPPITLHTQLHCPLVCERCCSFLGCLNFCLLQWDSDFIYKKMKKLFFFPQKLTLVVSLALWELAQLLRQRSILPDATGNPPSHTQFFLIAWISGL